MEKVRLIREKLKRKRLWVSAGLVFSVVMSPSQVLSDGGGANRGRQLIQETYSATEEGREEIYAESRFGFAPPKGGTKVLPVTDEEVPKARPGWSNLDGDRGDAYASGTRETTRAVGSPAGRSPAGYRVQGETRVKFQDTEETVALRKNGIQEVALIAGDLGFFPKTVMVTRDIPVRMFVTGASKGSLCIMMDSFQVRKQIRTNRIEEIVFTPNRAGQYRFYCPVNGTEGNLVVSEYGQKNQ
ncbi:MAG: cupredoxin domain-containing protein [Bdellovibrionales bacterium]|nr:cupredoxin domain-containing protein [Bdellovibrionales bacterium]